MSDDARADGVEVNVSEGGEEVRVVEHAAEEAALPEPAAAIEPTMEILGILAREMLHEPADGVLDLAGDDKVNVVGHDRVAVDANLAEIGVVVQESEKLGAVIVAEEDRLAIVAALGEVEWVSGGRESGFALTPVPLKSKLKWGNPIELATLARVPDGPKRYSIMPMKWCHGMPFTITAIRMSLCLPAAEILERYRAFTRHRPAPLRACMIQMPKA